jgi:hypothetical protein
MSGLLDDAPTIFNEDQQTPPGETRSSEGALAKSSGAWLVEGANVLAVSELRMEGPPL